MFFFILSLCILLALLIPVKVCISAFLNSNKNLLLLHVKVLGIKLLTKEFELTTLLSKTKNNNKNTRIIRPSVIAKSIKFNCKKFILSGYIGFLNYLVSSSLVSLLSLISYGFIKSHSKSTQPLIILYTSEELYNVNLNTHIDFFVKIKWTIGHVIIKETLKCLKMRSRKNKSY
jgi:hypothetical protein